jgi:hypothetical protein
MVGMMNQQKLVLAIQEENQDRITPVTRIEPAHNVIFGFVLSSRVDARLTASETIIAPSTNLSEFFIDHLEVAFREIVRLALNFYYL